MRRLSFFPAGRVPSILPSHCSLRFLCYSCLAHVGLARGTSPTTLLRSPLRFLISTPSSHVAHGLRTMSSAAPALTVELLKRQDDVCSGAVIAQLKNNEDFKRLSECEGELIIRRDREDDEKLAKGIQISIGKRILPETCKVPPVRTVNVLGLSAEQVAQKVIDQLPKKEGNIIVLQGLSGTGKGTTVSKLKTMLPKCVTWSNGNVFRCYTMLVNEMLSEKRKVLSTEEMVRDPALVEKAVRRITYKKVEEGVYDIFIDDKQRVKDIENTLLKTPFINTSVPVVAEQTQGEVIQFAQKAVKILSDAGYNIILEGRAQTLNYIYTEERFELVIPETALLGQRRAAQRVMAKALEIVQSKPDMDVSAAVVAAVGECLH